MASRRPRLSQAGSLRALIRPSKPPGTSICPFCSVTPASRPRSRARRDGIPRRFQSTAANSKNPRAELEQALLDLQKLAPELISTPRLQLALQGLRQTPGQEAVRVAVLGLSGVDAAQTAKDVLRVLIADPLKDEQEWERQLKDHDPRKRLIVRVGPPKNEQNTLTITKTDLTEINISSAEWNHHELEILFMETRLPSDFAGGNEYVRRAGAEEAALVPTVGIITDGVQVTRIATPVHKSLLVGNGMLGAVGISALPSVKGEEAILPAVNMKGVDRTQFETPFETVDLASAEKAVQLFRESTRNAMEYERIWSSSNFPTLVTWLKSGISSPDNTTKPVVKHLIYNILEHLDKRLKDETNQEILQMHVSANSKASFSPRLNDALAAWAQNAHAELQDELDLAFTGRRWRKLGWWQLFWRVDDVAMLTNEMLSQRFLPTAEQELVYLAGQIAEAAKGARQYPQPFSIKDALNAEPEVKRLGSGELEPLVPVTPRRALPKWPGHIAFTRGYLQNETIPALQALAQKLVMQSLGTSGVTTSLAALLYISSFSSTIFEAGAVAALGIMWSFNRMQKKWDAARTFWEGEVREEGRKAVKGAEESVAQVLNGGERQKSSEAEDTTEARNKIRYKVADALKALQRMK